jgi:trehalose 6-phosphate synthase/phosphatase
MQRGTQEGAPHPDAPMPPARKAEHARRSSTDDDSHRSPQSAVHPALHPSVTNVPVTPGVHIDGQSAYIQAPFRSPESAGPQSRPTTAGATFGPRWPDGIAEIDEATEAGGEELLRRLSLPGGPIVKDDVMDHDPRDKYPGLDLSGRILSATFTVPYDVGFAPGPKWVSYDVFFRSGSQFLLI